MTVDHNTAADLERIRQLLCCPRCAADLHLRPRSGFITCRGRLQPAQGPPEGGPYAGDETGSHVLECSGCHAFYPIAQNIPRLYCPNDWEQAKPDVTEPIRRFYEERPFPNYDDLDDIASLIHKAGQRVFARMLDEQIPFGATVLECGCGTGQLTNFLSVADRTVIGTDLSFQSLALAQQFKERNRLPRAHFVQMNLFRPAVKPESFDLVICNGVLHHTSDPFAGYQTLARLVKPRGFILVGLYHKFGRLSTDVRRHLFRISGRRFTFLDAHLRNGNIGEARKAAWFEDQYKNPHESKHTIREVQGWFEKTGVRFVRSIPKARFFAASDEAQRLFKAEAPPEGLGLLVNELMMTVRGSRDGGLFVAIGRKTA